MRQNRALDLTVASGDLQTSLLTSHLTKRPCNMIQVPSQQWQRIPYIKCVMYNTKFVQKLAFAYRNCTLSLDTTKHFHY